jgi:flavin-dependent dehydrogenase
MKQSERTELEEISDADSDPFTGEGIYYAILSAQLAAPVIANSLVHDRVKLEDYQEAVNEKIMSELRIAHMLLKIFIRFPHLAFRMLRRRDGVWRAGCGLMSGNLTMLISREG